MAFILKTLVPIVTVGLVIAATVLQGFLVQDLFKDSTATAADKTYGIFSMIILCIDSLFILLMVLYYSPKISRILKKITPYLAILGILAATILQGFLVADIYKNTTNSAERGYSTTVLVVLIIAAIFSIVFAVEYTIKGKQSGILGGITGILG
jgi:lysylphosphatidylglycerol synthetase-like protein (DUF2156 family)